MGHVLIHGGDRERRDSSGHRALRVARIVTLALAVVVTAASVLLVAGAWRNDRQIEAHRGVAQAEVLSAGPRRSTIEFVTADRITYRPELGVLYPSELADGMRIYVEYDTRDPEVVRVRDRSAVLAVVPALSVLALGWAVAAVVLGGLALLGRRIA